MPKGKNDELNDQLQTDGESADENIFDDLSPRFVRNLEEAAAEEERALAPRNEDPDDDDDEDEDLVLSGKDDDAEDVGPSDEEDEDADEPRRRTPFDKRVARFERLIEESRAEAAALRERLDQREAQDRLAASTAEFNQFKANTESELQKLDTEMAAAIENGESAKQAALNSKIIDLTAELKSRAREHERAKEEVTTTTQRRGASQITVTKVSQWKRRNQRYGKDKMFTAAVHEIDRELLASGSNPESDEHYAALDRKLKHSYPELFRKTPVRRHPSAQVRYEGGAVGQRRPATEKRAYVRDGKVVASRDKVARIKSNMIKFGMDPSNPKDMAEYVLNNPGI